MSLEGKSLCILTPMYGGQASFNFITSFGKLVAECVKAKVPVMWAFTANSSIISLARNELTHTYMKVSGFTHALLVDGDIGFEARDVLGILDSDYEVVGVPCTRRCIRWDRAEKALETWKASGIKFTPDQFSASLGDPVAVYENATDIDPYSPQPMLYLGTGLLMVKREVFEMLSDANSDRWYYSKCRVMGMDAERRSIIFERTNERVQEIFTMGVVDHRFEQEDYAFCRECRSIGVKPIMFPWIKTTHYGGYLYVGDLPAIASVMGEV